MYHIFTPKGAQKMYRGKNLRRVKDPLYSKSEGVGKSPEKVQSLTAFCLQNLVGYAGFEPATSPLSGVRSNQLS